jgi:hypothetical protein
MSKNTTTQTTPVETMSKSEVIAALVAGGETRSARALRDLRVSDLRALLVVQQQPQDKAPTEKARHPKATSANVEVETIDPKGLYTTAEIAEMVGLTKFAVRRWVRVGFLANVEVEEGRTGQAHVLGADLISFLTARSEQAEQDIAS